MTSSLCFALHLFGLLSLICKSLLHFTQSNEMICVTNKQPKLLQYIAFLTVNFSYRKIVFLNRTNTSNIYLAVLHTQVYLNSEERTIWRVIFLQLPYKFVYTFFIISGLELFIFIEMLL